MNGSRKISFTVLSMISIENTKFMGAADEGGDESRQGQMVCVDGGRLKRWGKSKRSEVPPDGHRSDSPGIFYKFPASAPQAQCGKHFACPVLRHFGTLRFSSYLFKCPPSTHTICPWRLSGFGVRKGISCSCFVFSVGWLGVVEYFSKVLGSGFLLI